SIQVESGPVAAVITDDKSNIIVTVPTLIPDTKSGVSPNEPSEYTSTLNLPGAFSSKYSPSASLQICVDLCDESVCPIFITIGPSAGAFASLDEHPANSDIISTSAKI